MESNLRKWMNETQELELDVDALQARIGSCHPGIYSILNGKDSRQKAEMLYQYFSEMTPKEVPIENKTDLKVFIVGGESKEIVDFLSEMYNVQLHVEDPDDTSTKTRTKNLPDLVIFTGGEDINPRLYDDNLGKFTVVNDNRDNSEAVVYHQYRFVPKLGIGRGAHFLTAMRGGFIIQHINGHDKPHRIVTNNGNYDIESDHHQMMYPYRLPSYDYDILAWSKLFRSDVYLDGSNKQIDLHKDFIEPEIIQYGKSSLCIQPRVELSENRPFRRRCLQYLKDFLSSESTKKKSSKDEVEDDYHFTLRDEAFRASGLQPSLRSYGMTSGKKASLVTKVIKEGNDKYIVSIDPNTNQEVARSKMWNPVDTNVTVGTDIRFVNLTEDSSSKQNNKIETDFKV